MNLKKTIISISLIGLLGGGLPAHAIIPVQVTSNSYVEAQPQIYGEQVVWQGKVNGNWQIFHYNITTVFRGHLT